MRFGSPLKEQQKHEETGPMDIKVGRKAIEEASKKLSNWGRWGKDDHIGTLNHVTPRSEEHRLNSSHSQQSRMPSSA